MPRQTCIDIVGASSVEGIVYAFENVNELHTKKPSFDFGMEVNPPTLKLRRVKRRGRDSNPRYLAVNTLSKRARSATLTPLRKRLQRNRLITTYPRSKCE